MINLVYGERLATRFDDGFHGKWSSKLMANHTITAALIDCGDLPVRCTRPNRLAAVTRPRRSALSAINRAGSFRRPWPGKRPAYNKPFRTMLTVVVSSGLILR